MALPSPPSSNQASPPYASDLLNSGSGYAFTSQHGPTPAPSPLAALPPINVDQQNARKRSRDDYSTEPPPKRIASGYQGYTSPSSYASRAIGHASQPVPRLTLPSLAIPPSSAPSSTYATAPTHGSQLPPLHMPARVMGMVYPNSSSQAPPPHLPAPVGVSSQPSSQYQSRQQSPYPGSKPASPAGSLPPSAASLHPPVQVSPTYFLQQRNSPYRPVHNVSTLLYPPSSTALQQHGNAVEQSQMHYQPLGKPFQQRQTGRLPYVAQNVWLDGNNHQHPMTPVSQWPSFIGARQQRPLVQQ